MKNLAFIYLAGLGTFTEKLIPELEKEYNVASFEVTSQEEIDIALHWGDIIWFEWANFAASYGSKVMERKPSIVRLHSYEVFTKIPENINWKNIDRLLFVAPHIKEIFERNWPSVKSQVIYNGIDSKDIKFELKSPGSNIAMIANVNSKKNFPMALQILHKLPDYYKLHIAGKMQDLRYETYLKHMINEMELTKQVIFHGEVKDISSWLKDKQYILSTSIHEGHPYNIMEGMLSGCKPLIHNYWGAEQTWPSKFLFNSIETCVNRIRQGITAPKEYRNFIEKNYSFSKQIKQIKEVLSEIS